MSTLSTYVNFAPSTKQVADARQFYVVDGLSFINTAVRMLATPLAILASIVVSGYVLSKTKRFKWSNVLGLATLSTGFALLFTLKYSSGLGEDIGYQIVYGAGVGVIFPGRMMAVQSAQAFDDDVGMAASLVGVTLNLGQCFGLALGIGLFDNIWNAIVDNAVADKLIQFSEAIYANTIQENLDRIAGFPLPIKSRYEHAGREACSYAFLAFAVVCGVTMVLSFASKDISFKKHTETKLLALEKDGLPNISDLGEASRKSDHAMCVQRVPLDH